MVGGSHGKTTTTSMIMHVLQGAGKAFDYMVGARLPGFEYSVSITDAPVIICEGDEYPASVLGKTSQIPFSFSSYCRADRYCLGPYQCVSQF